MADTGNPTTGTGTINTPNNLETDEANNQNKQKGSAGTSTKAPVSTVVETTSNQQTQPGFYFFVPSAPGTSGNPNATHISIGAAPPFGIPGWPNFQSVTPLQIPPINTEPPPIRKGTKHNKSRKKGNHTPRRLEDTLEKEKEVIQEPSIIVVSNPREEEEKEDESDSDEHTVTSTSSKKDPREEQRMRELQQQVLDMKKKIDRMDKGDKPSGMFSARGGPYLSESIPSR